MSARNVNRSNAVLTISRRRREGGAEATLSCPPAGNETCPERQKNDPTTFYGCNVFDDKAMRRHLPRSVYRSLRQDYGSGRAARSGRGRRGGQRHERLGHGTGSHPLHPCVLPPDRSYRRKA